MILTISRVTKQYPFGYGLSYTNFSVSNFRATATSPNSTTTASTNSSFTPTSTITFSVDITNTGDIAGSYVPQVYLLGRVSSITRPVRQLVAFTRVYLSPGETATATMDLDVARYLTVLDRAYQWVVEPGAYTFALMENGGSQASTAMNVTMSCCR